MNEEQEIKYIEKLLRNFFEGITTTAEEKTLYTFFKGNNVPQNLLKYKEVFKYFETGLANELDDAESHYTVLPVPSRNYLKLFAGIAACFFVIIAGISVFTYSQDSFNHYEGSYIVRNGEQIKDLEKIQAELELTIKEAAEKRKAAEELLNQLDESVKKINRLEQEIQMHRTQFLDNFPEGYARNEVKTVLEN